MFDNKFQISDLVFKNYTILNVDENKKPIQGNKKGLYNWLNLTHDEIFETLDLSQSGFGLRLGLQGNNKKILSLDFDAVLKKNGSYIDCEETKKLLEEYKTISKNNDGFFKSSTKGNFNLLVDYTEATELEKILNSYNKNKFVKSGCGLEILFKGLQVIPPTITKCKRTGLKENQRTFLNNVYFKQIKDNDEIFNFIIKYIKQATEQQQPEPEPTQEPEQEEPEQEETETEEQTKDKYLIDILNNIDIKFWDDYESWKRLIWALKNEGYNIKTAKKYSKKSNNYTKEGFKNTWNKPPKNNLLKQGTINFYSKLSNEKNYFNIIYKYLLNKQSTIDFFKVRNDLSFSMLIMDLLKDEIILNNENELYFYNGLFWVNDDFLILNIIQNKIIDLCKFRIQEQNKNLDSLASSENIKDAVKVRNIISSIGKVKTILEQLKISLSINKKNIEFDTYKPNIFCWNNKAFDLETNKEYKILKEDYISIKNGFDYTEPTEEEINQIDKIFDSIFPNPEMKKTYISILRSGLSGIRQEKLFMANGQGRNGKGLLNELMMAVCGNYGHKLNISVLTEKIKSGANPEVNNLNLKRFVVANEPNDNEQIQVGNIKRLTGDDRIDARGLYSSNGKTNLNLSLVLELNKMIQLNGRVDNAIIERLVSVKFESFFTTDEETLKTNPKAKKGNPYFKTNDFKENYKAAFFKYLLESPKELYICKKAKNDTKNYLLDNDDFYQWFFDVFEQIKEPQPKDYLQIKNIFETFKHSDLYQNLSRAAKRKANLTNFKIHYIEENQELNKYFIEDYQNPKFKVHKRNIIFGWRYKQEPKFKDDNEQEQEED